MASVVIRDVRKAFGLASVIHGVTITIDDGQFVVLVGPSGCGKSELATASSTTCRRKSAMWRWCSRTMRCIRI